MYSVLPLSGVSSVSNAPAAFLNTAPLLISTLRPLFVPIRLPLPVWVCTSVALSSVTLLVPTSCSSPETVSVPPGTSTLFATVLPPLTVPALQS